MLKHLDEQTREDHEIAEWAWNSHYWVKDFGRYECAWCGMYHSSTKARGIDKDFPLCRKNYAVKRHIEKLTGKAGRKNSDPQTQNGEKNQKKRFTSTRWKGGRRSWALSAAPYTLRWTGAPRPHEPITPETPEPFVPHPRPTPATRPTLEIQCPSCNSPRHNMLIYRPPPQDRTTRIKCLECHADFSLSASFEV